MKLVRNHPSDENRIPRPPGKDRFVYTVSGLFAGMSGIHNFYLGRYLCGAVQALTALLWIMLLRYPWSTPSAARMSFFAALALFFAEIIWVTLELFLISREPGGAVMKDDARSLRFLLIAVFWIAFILLPLAFTLLVSGPDVFLDPVHDRLEGASTAAVPPTEE